MDKTDRSAITRLVDKAATKNLDAKSKAKESASKLLGKRGPAPMATRPRGM